jgi:hypothetical protein
MEVTEMITITSGTVAFVVAWIIAVAVLQTLNARGEERRENPSFRKP